MVDVGAGTLKLLLELVLTLFHAVMVSLPRLELPLDVLFLGQASVTFEHLAFQTHSQGLIPIQCDLKLVDLQFVSLALLLQRDS